MNANQTLLDERPQDSALILVLEWITATVLLLVLAVLAWMPVADFVPTSWRPLTLEVEIVGVVGLLIAALLLVSCLALLHTRTTPHPFPSPLAGRGTGVRGTW